ncbi:MAG: ATP-binding protein [Candidatus Methanofastidiosa archaeon]|nr:ATP-binding protein [Candidatus Methanofastidiosa archaeon]
MQKYPYIYISGPSNINLPKEYDNDSGVCYKNIEGFHSIWAARVPFLPAMLSQDFERPGLQRISLIQQRQFRFIYDLARIRENHASFVLRFISTPNPIPEQPNLVDIIFLGKTFTKNKSNAQLFAESTWERFSSVFPSEEPFNYPLETIDRETEFLDLYQPIPFDSISTENLLEIRKYEDMPISSTSPLGRVEKKGDYIAYPFVPDQNFNPLGSFLQTLTTQPAKCFVDIGIRPIHLFDQEIFNVSFMIGKFKKTASEDNKVAEEYIRKRSQIGMYVYDNLMLEREQLLMFRVQLVGDNYTPKGLASALGSEMMGNAANKYPTMWDQIQPADESQLNTAKYNIVNLEHDIWGYTIADKSLERLRYLVTAQEAYGAFRLPVPPESGYMPGLLIRNEPFITPVDELEYREQKRKTEQAYGQSKTFEKKIGIGKIYHRGNQTAQDYFIPVKELTRHMLITGSTGSGKTTTIKHILSQLWIDYHIPFMVLYPVNKPDYRDLLEYDELYEDLLIFTLSDETTSPFRFNPFEAPKGTLIKGHISRIMRVFESAFSLADPLPMIYREALRKIYRDKGWNILLDRSNEEMEFPIMSEFYKAIDEITNNLNYGRETQDNVRQASVIRIGDLLENAGHVVNVKSSGNFTQIMSEPTIMELGRIGSMSDIALIMGFLLTRLQEEIEQKPRTAELPHITVVEEAHRLMAKTGKTNEFSGNTREASGEDFSNMLAEVRGYGEGIIVAEQIPTLLVQGAIGNTYLKIMHWIEDPESYELFSDILNLNSQQKEYARTLKTGFAIARSPFGTPIHLKVPNPEKSIHNKSKKLVDLSDKGIQEMMRMKIEEINLDLGNFIKWDNRSSLSAFPKSKDLKQNLFLKMPMQTCAFCPWISNNININFKKCLKDQVNKFLLNDSSINLELEKIFISEIEKENHNDKNYYECVRDLIQKRYQHLPKQNAVEWSYCYTSHKADILFHQSKISDELRAKVISLLSNISS